MKMMIGKRMSLVTGMVLALMCSCSHAVRGSQVAAAAHTVCSDGNLGGVGGCRSSSASASSAAHSSYTGPDGITYGECAYTNPQGQAIKIKYREFQDGNIEAESNSLVTDAVFELNRCRSEVVESQKVAEQNAQEIHQQIQAEHQLLQQQLQRQHQQLQEQILRQQQEIFNQQQLHFPNFHQPGFGQFKKK